MLQNYIYKTIQRYRTLYTDHIRSLPIAILMPHSACNCRCAMCDIWKDNKNAKQLTEDDVNNLLSSFKKLGTRQVVMSGGEALLNPNFFLFCEILQKHNIKVTLLSTGLTIKRHAEKLLQSVNDLIISLDGDEPTHDTIRNINGAFSKLKEGVQHLKNINPAYRITGRTVIHRFNYKQWPTIINTAKEIGLNQISFLPADVSTHAFNRDQLWDVPRQHEILLSKNELPVLQEIIEYLIQDYKADFNDKFIAESPDKLRQIYQYYAAFYGIEDFPYKKCNAPWVSTVIEADGNVRPCFFHDTLGNIHKGKLSDILNSQKAYEFRQTLDIETNPICRKCVCYLNLPPTTNI